MAIPSVGGGQQIGDGNLTEVKLATQGTIATATVTATLTVTQVLAGIIRSNPGGSAAATYTLPTGTLLDATLTNAKVGSSVVFSINNISTDASEDVTVAVGTGITAYGNLFVASNAATTDKSSGRFQLTKTGTATYDLDRLS